MRSMTTPAAGRDTFSLRFKEPRNREALRHLAELTGQPMTVIAERAIEHEVTMLAADLELRLADALEVVRGYNAERDLDSYLDAAAAGEESDLGSGLRVIAAHAESAGTVVSQNRQGAPALEVLAAFSRH